jgi:hypothetical protein
MAGCSRPLARHAKVPKVAVDHLTRSKSPPSAPFYSEPTPSPLNRIVRTLGGGTEGSIPLAPANSRSLGRFLLPVSKSRRLPRCARARPGGKASSHPTRRMAAHQSSKTFVECELAHTSRNRLTL